MELEKKSWTKIVSFNIISGVILEGCLDLVCVYKMFGFIFLKDFFIVDLAIAFLILPSCLVIWKERYLHFQLSYSLYIISHYCKFSCVQIKQHPLLTHNHLQYLQNLLFFLQRHRIRDTPVIMETILRQPIKLIPSDTEIL